MRTAQVFFTEMKYTYVTTNAAYSAFALLCDVGGAFGLVLGSTLLTFCQVADVARIAVVGVAKSRIRRRN